MSTSSGLTLEGKLWRDTRIVGLLFASTTSMIGSGWDILLVTLWSLVVLWLVMRCALDRADY
ncbi:hypothetical protein GXB81_03715 [Paraburkholderia sp. Ac-20336]|uniref:hypothetical protein n=1 Tax=Paraburkholderia sp. Ac-20336 TaxID=2703886 RepID=UPI00197DBA91|nr:hypothetical protein [Paraburkholderia sp. Ac-20336]MBN3802163.1 hypothetical protein [Paraburkholderia sp. Ac-20336]